MIGIIIFVLCLLVAIGYAVSTRGKFYNGRSTESDFFKWLSKPVLILIIGIIISIFQPYSFDRVDMGHIGLKVNLVGDERGLSNYQYKTGWVTFNSWTEKLYEFPTFQQHIEYEAQQVITKGGFSATITPTFNYSLKSDKIGDMFQQLKLPVNQIEQGWLKTAILSSVNDVANVWTVDSIFNHRGAFESSIITECNKRVSSWFLVSQLRTNITPPEALQAAILAKTKAIQDAQGEMQKALVADAKAKVKIANAKGDSASVVIAASGRARATVIEADGESQAMKLKQKELTQTYIDYIRASNWNGQYPTTMLGNGSQTLFNLK